MTSSAAERTRPLGAAAQLILVLLSTAAVAVPIGAWIADAALDDARDSAERSVAAHARLAASQVGTSVQQARVTLQGAAGIDVAAAAASCGLNFRLQGLPQARLDILDGTGQIVCSSDSTALGQPEPPQATVPPASAGDPPPLFDDPISGSPAIAVHGPARGGRLVAVLPVAGVADALEESVNSGLALDYAVWDPTTGRLVSSTAGTDVPSDWTIDGTGISSALDGRSRVYATVREPVTGWAIAASETTGSAFAAARELRGRLLVLGLVALAGAALLTFGAHRRVVRPMRRMAAELRAGRSPDGGGVRELTVLAKALRDAVAARDLLAHERAAAFLALADVRDAERRSLAVALHDDALQHLTAATLALGLLEQGMGDPETAREYLGVAQAELSAAAVATREVVTDLFPAAVAHGGLGAALEGLAAEGPPAVTVEIADPDGVLPRLDEREAVTLYRTAQEAVRNATRHARADRIDVRFTATSDAVVLTVSDDGQGVAPGAIETAARHGHFGVLSMRETVAGVGGTFTISTNGARGVEVRAVVPLGVASRLDDETLAPTGRSAS